MELAQTLVTPLVLVFLGIVGAYLLKERLDRIEARVDALPTRAEWDARFSGVDAQFTGVDARFESIDERFKAVDKRFDAVDERFDRLERAAEWLAVEMAAMRSDLTHVALAVGARPRPQAG